MDIGEIIKLFIVYLHCTHTYIYLLYSVSIIEDDRKKKKKKKHAERGTRTRSLVIG